jgi:hypothetical protein
VGVLVGNKMPEEVPWSPSAASLSAPALLSSFSLLAALLAHDAIDLDAVLPHLCVPSSTPLLSTPLLDAAGSSSAAGAASIASLRDPCDPSAPAVRVRRRLVESAADQAARTGVISLTRKGPAPGSSEEAALRLFGDTSSSSSPSSPSSASWSAAAERGRCGSVECAAAGVLDAWARECQVTQLFVALTFYASAAVLHAPSRHLAARAWHLACRLASLGALWPAEPAALAPCRRALATLVRSLLHVQTPLDTLLRSGVLRALGPYAGTDPELTVRLAALVRKQPQPQHHSHPHHSQHPQQPSAAALCRVSTTLLPPL